MNLRGVLFLLGRILIAVSAAMLIPLATAYFTDSRDLMAFAYSAGIVGVVGFFLQRTYHQGRDFAFGRHEAFLLVGAAWLVASVVGALPFIFIKGAGFWVDALFESASGFTTTGATILPEVESLSNGFLLWRSEIQWIGGMGIIVLGIAILPKLAVGGVQLLGAEAPGPTTEKLTPRIAQTAKALWLIYLIITAVECVALRFAGMSWFDAICHSMTTVSSGGFSTKNLGIAQFDNPWIETIIIAFMIAAGMNFALHFSVLRGRLRRPFEDPEFRFYLGVLFVASCLVGFDLVRAGNMPTLEAFRHSTFQVVSIMTTTGYASVNFDTWPDFTKILLLLLMFIGGCAGSTSGSTKVVRVLIALKKIGTDLRLFLQPHAIRPVRLGNQTMTDEVVSSVTSFFFLFLTLTLLGTLVIAFSGLDLISSFSATAACITNVGPGLGAVGPMENFASMPAHVKLLLVALMITGRLELFTVLVLLLMGRRRLSSLSFKRKRRSAKLR